MAEIMKFPASHARTWRKWEQFWREQIAAKGVAAAAAEKVLAEFKGYHAELFSDQAIDFQMKCDEPLSEAQQAAMKEALHTMAEGYERYCDSRIGIAKDIILDLLVEKHR
ncbi:hypothetical protein ACFPU0_25565 [Pseudomonas sp. GCM10022186]|uniref:hypothetical protein n=1 Tax=Pseudomonas sp. GCM10022186 TaxID=3252650 RepID=UPI00361A991F